MTEEHDRSLETTGKSLPGNSLFHGLAAWNRTPRLVLPLSVCCIFLFLIFRNAGQYPHIFGDEQVNSWGARVLPFCDYIQPNFLFFLVFGITKYAGDASLEYARVLNAIFFLLSVPIIYSISRKVAGEKASLIVALAAALSGPNAYTLYFMPDSLYYLCFWIFAAQIFNAGHENSIRAWSVAGLFLGISSLVKPHGLFMLGPVALLLLILNIRGLRRGILLFTAFAVATVLSKMIFGYLIAGPCALTLFGPSYSSFAGRVVNNGMTYLKTLVWNACYIWHGHILGVIGAYSFPLLCSAPLLFRKRDDGEKNDTARIIALFTLCCLFVLPIIISVFIATTIGPDAPAAVTTRIHMRYYNFLFPLLYVVAASCIGKNCAFASRRFNIATGLVIVGCLCYVAYTRLQPFVLSACDNPDLFGLATRPKLFYILMFASLIMAGIWMVKPTAAAKLFIFGYLPLFTAATTINITSYSRASSNPTRADRVGLFVQQFLTLEERSRLLFVCPWISAQDHANVSRQLLYTDNPKVAIQRMGQGDTSFSVPEDRDYVIVSGGYPLPSEPMYAIAMNGFMFACYSQTIDFTIKGFHSSKTSLFKSISGLSGQESWGRWTDGKRVEFECAYPLPKKFRIIITGRAFGPNIGKKFKIALGDSEKEFVFPDGKTHSIALDLENAAQTSRIVVEIPEPAAPKDVWGSDKSSDTRKLGMALVHLTLSTK